jgi:hypothetical protein
MYLTKPVGVFFQLLGFIIGIASIGVIPQGGGVTFFGIIFVPLGVWMVWRGRRGPERKAELNPH